MSSKARVKTRVSQALGSQSTNKSSDLISASNNYEVMKKRLKLLLQSVKNHHQAILQVHKTRVETVKLIGVLSVNSPLFDLAGQLSKAEDPNNFVCSYASVHTDMASQSKLFDDRYGKFVVEYICEWERVVTGRISAGLKKEQQLRVELDHYQKKVESLRTNANVTLAKGKMVDPKAAEKLSRNEEKFLASRRDYEKFKNSLCILIDEATLRSWKDLHPLVLKMAQFDLTVARAESNMFAKLDQVIENLKTFAEQNNISGDSRLSNLESMDVYELSGTVEKEVKQIENGPSTLNPNTFGSSGPMQVNQMNWNSGMPMNNTPSYDFQQPGQQPQMTWNVSPMNSSGELSQYQFQTQQSYGSDTGTTMGMLDIAARAAPPPTFDSLNESVQSMSFTNPNVQTGNNNTNPFSMPSNNNSNHGMPFADPFTAASNVPNANRGPTPTLPNVPPPPMPPPLPPSQSSHQQQQQQHGDPFAMNNQNPQPQSYNQLTISTNSTGYNNQGPLSSPISGMNNQAQNSNHQMKNPFDMF